jgi:malonyl-CoA/methylmalonyl-CoA synthetase
MNREQRHDRQDWATHGFTGEAVDLIAAGSLPAAWTKQWARNPQAPVLLDYPHGDPGIARASFGGSVDEAPQWITAGELDALTRDAALRFAAAGVVRGDRIVMSCAPSVNLIVAHVGALRLGAIVVPVNPAYSATEVARVFDVAKPTIALADDPARMVSTIGLSFVSVSSHNELPTLTASSPSIELDVSAPDDPAMLMFTSGTTGAPKGVVLSHGNILSSAEALRISWRWTTSDRLVLALPLFHMHGLGVCVHGTLLAGASAVVVEPFGVDSVLDAAAEQQATLLFAVPTMWVRIAASPRVGELAGLRLCVSGSAPLSSETWEALAVHGHQRILERYGMTETVMNISNPYEGDRRAGSVGLALPGVEVRLLPSGSGDEPGEIVLRGPNVLSSYWERPDATAEAFTEDGWFKTGDLGQFDPDGYLRIVGRSKELIIAGGFNVYPREVEETLASHELVREAAVVGQPHAEWGETVVAFVVLHDHVPPADEPEIRESLLAHAAEHLAKYKRPREIHFQTELPRNALGKIIRSALQKQPTGLDGSSEVLAKPG